MPARTAPSGNAVKDFQISVFLIRVFRVIRGEFGADVITCCVLWVSLACAAGVRRGKVVLVPWVRDPSWRAVGPPGSNRSRSGGNERSRAFDEKGRFSRSASVRAVTRSERRVGLENASCGSRPSVRKGKATSHEPRQPGSCGSAGAMTMARHKGIDTATREIRCGDRCWDDRPDSCEGMTGPHRKSERLVVPLKRGNARGGKGSHFPRSIQRGEGRESDASL